MKDSFLLSILTLVLVSGFLFSSCDKKVDRNLEPIQEADSILHLVSYVEGSGIHMSRDSLIITVKDSFTLYDPFFCDEVSSWLGYSILRKYPSVNTVYYDWLFNSDGKIRKEHRYTHRGQHLSNLKKRYSNEQFFDLMGENLTEKKFRQYTIALYHFYGAILAHDTTIDVKHIYNENILDVFASYAGNCDSPAIQKTHAEMMNKVDKLSQKMGKGDGGYSSELIHRFYKVCQRVASANPLSPHLNQKSSLGSGDNYRLSSQ